MDRKLILNADDFGSFWAANEAVEQSFDRGFLTSTTLMTCCAWAEDAIARAKANPKMHVGLHITTTAEYPRLPWGSVADGVSSLTDARGYFYPTARESLLHATGADMAREIEAQFEWMRARGVAPDHIDNHMATVYGILGPGHLQPVFALCARYGIGFRLPARAPGSEAAAALAKQTGVHLIDHLLSDEDDVAPGDTYESFRELYLNLIRACKEGVNELYMHPCVDAPEVRYVNSQWQKRVWEYQLLQDDVVYNEICKEGLKLVSYPEAFEGEI